MSRLTDSMSRRTFVTSAGLTGLASAASPRSLGAGDPGTTPADGTPEQIHLTWGEDPASSVCVSWASPDQAHNPRVHLEESAKRARTIHAVQRTYTDGLNGQTVFTYHAAIGGLEAGREYNYAVTADNDRHAERPFRAAFKTAARGRIPFRWTSYGDLATPVASWTLSSPQSAFAVKVVERFEPLFHLLNGDLCYANLNPSAQPAVWADFGNNVEASAARRPWMPLSRQSRNRVRQRRAGFQCLSHAILSASQWDGISGLVVPLPDRFRAIHLALGGRCHLSRQRRLPGGPRSPDARPSTGNPPIIPGTSLYNRGYSGGAQTRWLEATLLAASRDDGIDWIIVQMHQDALSSSKNGNGSDKGIREAWLPLFDRYGVDLVLCGHDHDYERSWPVRGCNHHVGRDARTGAPVDTLQPQPVVTANPADGVFDTSRGTIHFILGGGGTSSPLDAYGVNPANGKPQAKVLTRPNRPVPGSLAGTFSKPGADALEDAIWSARRDTDTGYGIAVFDLDPGVAGGKTSITMAYYHALGADRMATPNYELFETVVLAKTRRDTSLG